MCDLGPQLQVVSGLVVGGTVRAQSEHAAGEAGEVAHLPLQVSVLPLADERQAAVGLANQVALDSLERKVTLRRGRCRVRGISNAVASLSSRICSLR